MKSRLLSIIVVILITTSIISCGAATPESTPTQTNIPATSTAKPPTNTPSPEFINMILDTITTKIPNIKHNEYSIPIAIFGNGAEVTIGAADPISFGPCVFISDPQDQLVFTGGSDDTKYQSGTGAVICDGIDVYLYNIYLPNE